MARIIDGMIFISHILRFPIILIDGCSFGVEVDGKFISTLH